MKLLFKQRLFSWFDSYDIYDEDENVVFTVKGKLSWGHRLEIYDANGLHTATLQEKVFTFLPKFEIYINENYVGEISKEMTFFKPSFSIDCRGWQVEGDFWEWDYKIINAHDNIAARIEKQILNFTDTYVINVSNPNDALLALMVTLAIDAVKCSKNN